MPAAETRVQLATVVLPGGDTEPLEQLMHELAPSADENVPLAHTLQAVAATAASTAENVPAKHWLQFPAPCASLNVPAGHGTLS